MFHAARPEQLFLTLLGILMTLVVVMGLVRRQRHGMARIGWESALLLAIYLAGVTMVAWGG